MMVVVMLLVGHDERAHDPHVVMDPSAETPTASMPEIRVRSECAGRLQCTLWTSNGLFAPCDRKPFGRVGRCGALRERIVSLPPVEYEAGYYRTQQSQAMAA
jgi:hypothetical protein